MKLASQPRPIPVAHNATTSKGKPTRLNPPSGLYSSGVYPLMEESSLWCSTDQLRRVRAHVLPDYNAGREQKGEKRSRICPALKPVSHPVKQWAPRGLGEEGH